MPDLVITVVVLGVPLFVCIVLYRWHIRSIRRKRRTSEQLRELEAGERGWVPAPGDVLLTDVGDAICRADGKAINVMVGEYGGRPARFANYAYQSLDGIRLTAHLVAFDLPVQLPVLTLRRADPAVPQLDLELESPEFNRLFRVDCIDDRYASAVLHPRMMEWMLAHPGLEWRIDQQSLVTWAHVPWTVELVDLAFAELVGVLERIPPFVLTDYGVR
ncbi:MULTISPECIES: hypothetical protein [unclassified Kribbella]|uniref:hypothetical protein n=1 Tax=unclassified Kribbella TaxID=2644121 RepID=UPI003016D1AE